MRDQPAVLRLARRLNFVGSALLVAGAIAFVWAVGFTHGVDGLIEGLVVSIVGLFAPAMATFWVAWIISVVASDHPAQARPEPKTPKPRRLWELARNYVLAILLVFVAALTRTWLNPYIGPWVPFSTFYVAIICCAWIGGMGPAGVATALSMVLVWLHLDDLPGPFSGTTGDLVGTALFISVGLTMAGITSALRVTRSSNALLSDEIAKREAVLEEAESRYRAIADQAAEMLWLSDASHARIWVNHAWRAYTGRAHLLGLGDPWMESIHPDDLQRCRTRYREGFERREPFTVVFRLLSHDGSYRRVQDEAVPRYVGGRQFAGFSGRCVETNIARGRAPVLAAPADVAPGS